MGPAAESCFRCTLGSLEMKSLATGKEPVEGGWGRRSLSACRMTAVALALLASFVTLRTTIRQYNVVRRGEKRDRAVRADARLSSLRKYLPERGRAGYVSDQSTQTEFKRKFFLARYVLAPVVLEAPDGRHTFIITDQDDQEAVLEIPAGYVMVTDTGEGVRLWKRETPR